MALHHLDPVLCGLAVLAGSGDASAMASCESAAGFATGETRSPAAKRGDARFTGPVPEQRRPPSPHLVSAQRADVLRQISAVYALRHGRQAGPKLAPVAVLNAELARRGLRWRVRSARGGRVRDYDLR